MPSASYALWIPGHHHYFTEPSGWRWAFQSYSGPEAAASAVSCMGRYAWHDLPLPWLHGHAIEPGGNCTVVCIA